MDFSSAPRGTNVHGVGHSLHYVKSSVPLPGEEVVQGLVGEGVEYLRSRRLLVHPRVRLVLELRGEENQSKG